MESGLKIIIGHKHSPSYRKTLHREGELTALCSGSAIAEVLLSKTPYQLSQRSVFFGWRLGLSQVLRCVWLRSEWKHQHLRIFKKSGQLRDVEVKVVFGLNPTSPTLHLPVFLLTHLIDSHSKPWALLWNQHRVCRKWEISTWDRAGREREGGDKRKTVERTIDLTFGVHMSTFLVTASLPLPLSPPSLSPSFSLCLREHLLAVCVCPCMQLRLHLYSEVEGLELWQAPVLLFFPGTVICRISQESGRAASYFSEGLVFVVPRSKATWPHVTP